VDPAEATGAIGLLRLADREDLGYVSIQSYVNLKMTEIQVS